MVEKGAQKRTILRDYYCIFVHCTPNKTIKEYLNMQKEKFSKYLPYVVAIVVFALISCIYCAPVFQGKELYAGDNVRFKEAVHESSEFYESTGESTWWTGSMFAGMPNYQIGGGRYASTKLLKPLLLLFHPSHNNSLPLVFMLYFCSFFVLLRSVRVEKWLSIVGALAIGFSSYYFIIEPAGHHSKAWSLALMAVVVAGFFYIYDKRYRLGIVLTMVFTSMGFSPHPQMSYYYFMLIGVLFIAQIVIHIKAKRIRDLVISTALFAGSVIVGLGTGSASLFANSEYVKETMRGGHSDLDSESEQKSNGLSLDYMTAWSYGIDESLTFMIPGFMGNASGYNVGKESKLYEELTSKGVSKQDAAQFCESVPTYWGEQPFTAGPIYAGAAICFLFVLGLILIKGPLKWAILAATFFSFGLSWGKNWMWLTELFYNWFPMYGKFRSVSSILIVAEVTVPLLGFMAIKHIMDGKSGIKELNRAILISGSVTGGICLLLAVAGGSMFSFVSSNDAAIQAQLPDWVFNAIVEERASILRSDSMRSFMFIALAALLLWLYTNNKMRKSWMTALLGLLVVADMWPVDKRFFNDGNFVYPKQFESSFATLPYEKAIMADKDPHFRVLNLSVNPFSDSRTSYNLKSLGGYSAAKLRRYQDIIDQYLTEPNMKIVSMLNGKYVIMRNEEGAVVPMRNPDSMGNAWFVDSLVVVDDPVDECAALDVVNLHNTAVVHTEFSDYVKGFRPGQSGKSTIKLLTYAPNELTYQYESESPRVAVFSEVYYPYGWKAYIDDKPVDLFRVNYLLRALNVPEGTHSIRMEFRPDSVRKGNTIAIVFIVIMYGVVLGVISDTLIRRGRKPKSA